MNTTIQSTLLDLCQQVIEDPDHVPTIPLDVWPEGTEQQHLLASFRDMLERLQQHYQDKLEARDITSSKLAEEQLHEREEQYRSIFEATYDGLIISSLDGFVVEVNPAFCNMYGYTREELIGLHVGTLAAPVDQHILDKVLEMRKTGKSYQTVVAQALHKDGMTFYVESHGTTFTYRGNPHTLGVVRDITERVEAEQQLREREEQYRSIFETTYDGLVISDLENGCYAEVNPAFCRMFGYSREELIGMHSSALAVPQDQHIVDEVLEALKAGRNYQTVVGQVMHKDGMVFYVESNGSILTYKGKPHSLAVIRDITERVEAERQLREREEQYRSIFEATYDGLVINDLDGFCVEANPTYCRLLGYTSEEMIGLHYSQTTFPEYYPVLDENSRNIRAGVQFQTQGLARRKDGSALPVEALSIPFTHKGKPHMLGVMRDITERVQAEQQLREKEEQYRSVFEATIDGLIISNVHGLIIEANPAACKMYGYTYEEFVGLHGTDITSQDTHFLLAEALQTIRADSKSLSSIRATGLRKDGTTFPTEGYGTRIMYKGKPHILAVVRDITEQVRAEEQLREKEEQYRSIFEATTDGLIIRDMGGFVVEANPAAYTMHSYTYQEFIGLHRTDIIAPEDHFMVAEYMKAIQAGRTFQGQAVDLRKDGSAFPVEVRGSLFTYLGKPHTLSVLRDVTEREQAEQQIREREEQYRSVFEATTDGLIIIDIEDNRAVEANPRACQMFGYTYEEMVGRPINITDDTQQPPLNACEVIKAGGFFQMRETATGKDGLTFNAEVHATPFTYKGKPHMLAIVRDITEQVQAERQLREKEEQYRAIFEATTDGLVILDQDGFYVEANPANCRMFGYTREELIGLHASALTAPESLHLVGESMELVKEGREIQAEGLALRKDGSVFHAEAQLTPFIYQGKPHMLGVTRDITERVEAEKQLREKEEQYRNIFEATNDALFIMDLEDGHIVEANPAACNIYGYSYEEFIGLPPSAVIHPSRLPGLTEISLPLIRAGGKRHVQGVNLRKDGSAFPIDLHQTAITYQGKPHMLSVMRDITEQVRAEEQLREREEQYRSIFEATTDGLFITDFEDGHLVQVNPAACRMHGYSYEEFIALHPTAFIHPNSHHLFAEYLQTVRAGGQFHARAYDIRKDGTTFPVEVYGTTFIYKSRPHVLGIVRDITKQVQAEEQLREKEEQYRSIFEATNDGLDILDPDGFIVEANPAFCSMFGYTREELIGRPAGTLTAPQSLHLVEESRESIKEGRDSQVEGLALRKDGSIFHAEAHLTPLIYQGKPHMLGVTRDITEQVQAQQLLEQRVEERTRELSTLLEVSHNVASTIELKPLLDLILDQLKAMVNYTGSSLTILEHEDLVLVGTRGPESEEHLIQRRFSLKHLGLIWEMICRGEPVIIDDVCEDAPLAQAYREAVGELLQTTLQYVHSWIAVPLVVKEQVIGMLAASHSEAKYYAPRHVTLALAIANQAAIAIENARLYEQAQELAAVEERQRLARELHDSVSQALYGISLGVHTARLQLDSNPAELTESLDYVLELAEAALAEMRALIFELRPESLEAEGLVTALTKQAAALHARHNIVVQLDLCSEPDVSLKVKRELYRVAQEALHNTVKHAEANRVDLRLRLVDGMVMLEVRDDGKGFEATGSFPGHLGLHSMRERIESLDGGLQIESAPGQGTSIRAHIPTRKTTELTIGE